MDKEMLFAQWQDMGIDERIIDAVDKIPREEFIDQKYREYAYEDVPLPTISGQTISQPTTVVIMLKYLEIRPGLKILEIGCGSGWNAALMAHIVGPKGKVVSMDIRDELVRLASSNVTKVKGIPKGSLTILQGNGRMGYKKLAPYDRIIVTAASSRIFDEWVSQTKDGGIILAPIGTGFGQQMVKAKKTGAKLRQEVLGYFQFVPLIGGEDES